MDSLKLEGVLSVHQKTRINFINRTNRPNRNIVVLVLVHIFVVLPVYFFMVFYNFLRLVNEVFDPV